MLSSHETLCLGCFKELIGDAVISRNVDGATGAETIRQQTQPGGLLTAQICVLEDITRCPGEALVRVTTGVVSLLRVPTPLHQDFFSCVVPCNSACSSRALT